MKPPISSKYGEAIAAGLSNNDFTATCGKILILLQSLHAQGEYDIWRIESNLNSSLSLLGMCVRTRRYDVLDIITKIWGKDKIISHTEEDGRNLLSHLYGQALFTRETFSKSVKPLMADYIKVISVLKKVGVSSEAVDNQGQNLIHLAANTLHTCFMKEALLGAQISSINQPDNNGNTPLHIAISPSGDNNTHIHEDKILQAKILLEHGADPFIENKEQKSAYAIIMAGSDDINELKKLVTEAHLRKFTKRKNNKKQSKI